MFWPVLRIRDILVRIRIRILICGSMPLTNWSGSGSCSFRHWPSRYQQKTNWEKSFSAYFCLKAQLHNFSMIKVKKKSQNRRNHRNQGFAYYFCLMIEGFGSVPPTKGSGSRRPKNIRIRRIRNRITNSADCCRRPLGRAWTCGTASTGRACAAA
jgi:hypothetical protein